MNCTKDDFNESQLENLIKSFFLHVLPEAYYGFNWDENSITSAAALAKSVENVYTEHDELAEQNVLDTILHSLSLKGKLNPIRSFCAQDMKKASSLLLQALLENPSVGKNKLLSVLPGSLDFSEEFQKQIERNTVCDELIEALKPLKITNSEKSFYHEIKAELYLDYLKNSIEHIPSKDLVEDFLSSMIEQLCNNNQEIFINLLMHKTKDNTVHSEIKEFALNWTLFKLMSEKSPFVEFLWKQHSKLSVISENSSFFHLFYLNFLTRCSSSLVFSHSEMKWIPKCLENSLSLQFDEILNHFRSLLQSSEEVRDRTYFHLINLLNTQPNEVIWKDIFARVT